MKRKMKLFPVFILFACSLLAVTAQVAAQSTVNGRVLADEGKTPIAGAIVSVKNTKKSVTTDSKGAFVIQASTNDKLEVRSLGFNTLEQTISGNEITFLLTAKSKELDEVVVTALGIKKESKKISYALQELKTTDLLKAREPNPINSLKGKVAGLVVNINSELLRQPSINFRGEGNILFVVDGVPIKTDTWNISADDIESYSFLRGQTAASLYGSNGRDGVIIINTKKGTKDKRGYSVEFNSSTMFESGFLAMPKLQHQYGPGSNGKYAFRNGLGGGVNDNDYDIWGPKFNGQLLPQYDGTVDPTKTYVTSFADGSNYTGNIVPTPWLARGPNNLENFLQTGLLSNNHIAISSSNDKYDLRFGVGHTYQKSIIPNMDLNITNFNMAGGYQFSSKVKMSANINYSRQYSANFPDVNYGPNSLIYNMSIWAGSDWDVREMRDYWQTGKVGIQQKYAEYQRYNNPYFMVNEWLRGHYKNDIYGYLTLDYKFAPHFNLMFRPGISTYGLLRTEKMPYSAGSYNRDDRKGDYREDNRSFFESNNEVQVRYSNRLLKNFLQLDGMLGGNAASSRYNGNWSSTDYLTVPGVYNLSNTLNRPLTSNWAANQLILSGYYSFDIGVGKYATVSTTGRIDKHSNLPIANNAYAYYSIGASSVVSDYVQLPELISFAKAKASYATGKNPRTFSTVGPFGPGGSNPLGYGDNYQSPYGMTAYEFGPATYGLSNGYNNALGAAYTDILNDPSIIADNRKTLEIGAEVKFLKNRVGIDVTYYNSVSELLVRKSISSATGYTSFNVNQGKYKNTGFEVVISGSPIKNKTINWEVLGTLGSFRRVWINNPNPSLWIKDGDRLDGVYVPGFVRTPDGQYVHGTDGLLMRFSDATGGPNARRYMGNGDPRFTWGLTNSFTYGNFRLSVQVDGIAGGVLWNQIRRRTVSGGRHAYTVTGNFGAQRENDVKGGTFVGDGITLTGGAIQIDPLTGEITNFNALTVAKNGKSTTVQQYLSRMASSSNTELMYTNKSFSKLREVTLTYNIPTKALSSLSFIKAANVSFVGRNLFLFFNPEFKDVDPDQFTQQVGSDIQSPSTRRFGFNVNITF